MKVLVTGGAGFIGSNIVRKLLKLNYQVTVLDNLSTGHINNLKNLDINFIYGDINDLEICRKAVKGINLICHQAALGSVPRSIKDPLSSHKSNVNGFLNILWCAKENNIKRVVYASSSSVYGDEKSLPKKENKIGNLLSPYAVTKHINEEYAKIFFKCYNLQCIGLRYFNIFGPRQDPNGPYAAVIPKFIKLIKQNQIPIINGDGSYSRDFTYIDNAVSANILALTTNNNKCFGEIFNIGAGGQITLNTLYKTISEGLNFNQSPIYGKIRKGDIPHSNADISKSKNLLNYNPSITFEKGINRLLKYER
jgi:UDP-N-acetylglucosamine 4-epimerase